MNHGHRHKHSHLQKKLKWVDRWYVESHTNPDKTYTVSLANDKKTWGCSCPHWTKNYPRPECKHIKEVKQLGNNSEHVTFDEFFTEEEFEIKI